MTVHAWQATLTTTAEEVVPATGIDGKFPRFVHISSASAAIRIGGSATDATDTDGFPFDDTSSPMVIALQPGDALWMRGEAATPTVQLLVTRSDVASE